MLLSVQPLGQLENVYLVRDGLHEYEMRLKLNSAEVWRIETE